MTLTVSSNVAEKAARLFSEGCVYVPPGRRGIALVKGDTGWRKVIAYPDTIRCDCRGWNHADLCSHAAAAALQWASESAAPGSVDDPPPGAAA